MIKIPFLGGTEFPDNIGLGAERLINLYPEQNKNKRFLRHTPGAQFWTNAGNGPIRAFEEWKGDLYVVSSSQLLKISAGGFVESIGNVAGTRSRCVIENIGAAGILILAEGLGYSYDGVTFTQIADPDFPYPAVAATFLDGFPVVVKGGTGEYYISENTYDLSSWRALDFDTAEARADDLEAAFSDKNLLFLFGSGTTEVAINTGNQDFPFEPIRQAMSKFGVQGRHTIAYCDGNVYWVGKNETGGRSVLRFAQGADPQKVSDYRLDDYLADLDLALFDEAFAFGLWWRGHPWYVLTIPEADTFGRTFVFDSSTDTWFEWSTLCNSPDRVGKYRASGHFYFNGKHIVPDGDTGTLYELKNNVYTDFDALEIVRQRTMGVLHNEMEPLSIAEFNLRVDAGSGTPGTDYTCELAMSRDGGHTFLNSRTRSLGKGGEKDHPLIWRRVGHAREGEEATLRWTTSAQCPITLRDGYIYAH